MQIDIDEKIEGMCDKCKVEIKKNKCIRCGKEVSIKTESVTNKNFDEEKFNALSRE